MSQFAPALPTRFPCWCRATYSWGGESKSDLGFMEGDLIECLNAGDGSWWMGRLRRDKRAMGLFPSNFVKVLGDEFTPISRSVSPMPTTSGSLSTPAVSPQKSKTFRKPFQAYVELGSRAPSPKVPASRNNSNAAPQSQAPTISRQNSFCPDAETLDLSRQFSFQENSSSPTRQANYLARAPPSASGYGQYEEESHRGSTTPIPYANPLTTDNNDDLASLDDSPPPPAPPPHRVAYNSSPPKSTHPATPVMTDRYPTMSRAQTPTSRSQGVHSPGLSGQTPSPLRDAMDDIMCSLEGMAMNHEEQGRVGERQQEHLDPWSPEAFEELSSRPNVRSKRRPRSSLGIASSQRGGFEDDDDELARHAFANPPPHADTVATVSHHHENHMDFSTDIRSAVAAGPSDELFLPTHSMGPPAPPAKDNYPQSRPGSSLESSGSLLSRTFSHRKLRTRKSAYELGRNMLERTLTTKSSATNSSSGYQSLATNGTTSTDRTSQSVMSGRSAGAFSATSAGSLARRKFGSIRSHRPMSVIDTRQDAMLGLNGRGPLSRPQTPSQYSYPQSRPASRGTIADNSQMEEGGGLGGLTAPKKRKSGFFKKLVDSAKTGAASARSSIAAGQSDIPRSPVKSLLPNGITAIAGGSAANDMGLGTNTEVDWVQIRRDVNRSNSLSNIERGERIERCQIMDYPVIAPEEALFEDAKGDEDFDGFAVQQPTDYRTVNVQLVDKSTRFVNNLPPMTNAISLAQGHVCRPYRSDLQRLRAIFTWVSEKIAWEEDFEGEVDSRRVIQMRRGCAEEVAVLVFEMCCAVGLHAEVVRGYLKAPSDVPDGTGNFRPNHWWNAVLVDGCWRIMDCSLASPTNPKRAQYSTANLQMADSGFFLARPMEICYTHVPCHYEQQHICPPIAADILLALPFACPPYFKHGLKLVDYDTSLSRIENLELVHVQFTVASDVECVAEVEARSYVQDMDGDTFESGDSSTTRALAQTQWIDGQKQYTVKAHLPGDERYGILKVYAGKRGLMHSIKDNPYPLAFAIPVVHQGNNPPYEFLLRHPTPQAMRHDLYVAQPQCRRLAINNTFVFAIRQHPSCLPSSSTKNNESKSRPASPMPFHRPTSALSMVSSAVGSASASDTFSQTSSSSSNNPNNGSDPNASLQQQKPAKLAIQSPSGKILRLIRKADNSVSMAEAADGGVWETIIKVGERGTWRGLVLADRSARWCVFGEWECV